MASVTIRSAMLPATADLAGQQWVPAQGKVQLSSPRLQRRGSAIAARVSGLVGDASKIQLAARTGYLTGNLTTKLRIMHEQGSRLSRCTVSAEATESKEALQTVGDEENVSEEIDGLMQGLSFGELCDEFECVSSPAVERTARQLARDISEMREEHRLLSCYGIFVKYKDPVRSFVGREKLKRPSWLRNALDKPKVVLLQMLMTNTSELVIRWRIRGNFRTPGASLVAGPLTLTVLSKFLLNQISGQVIEIKEEWELVGSSPAAAAYFWSSRLAWTVAESGRDTKEWLEGIRKFLDQGKESEGGNIYQDPNGDPRKFFQEANPNSELYQVGFIIALLYLLVQFLKQVL